MPHFHIEYSANLDDVVNMSDFCAAIRTEAALLDTFPLPGIRVRATRVDHYAIADGDPKHGFVDISVRLRGGRPKSVKQDATQAIFSCAKRFLSSYFADHSIALSLELRDIDPEFSPKAGSIRDHLDTQT